MKVVNSKTLETKTGKSVTVSVVKTVEPIRPAKHTSLRDIRKMAQVKNKRRFRRLFSGL